METTKELRLEQNLKFIKELIEIEIENQDRIIKILENDNVEINTDLIYAFGKKDGLNMILHNIKKNLI